MHLKVGYQMFLKIRREQRLASVAEARRGPLRFQFAQKDTHQHSVIADAAQAFQFRQSLPAALRRSKRTFGGHVDVGIGNRQDSCPLGNLLTLKATRITCPVEGFVVMLNRFLQRITVGQGRNNYPPT